MKFTSEIIKKAWQIRKAAAAKYGCGVKEIHFGICIEMAKAEIALPKSYLIMDEKSNVKMRLTEYANAGYQVYDNKNIFIQGITYAQAEKVLENAKKSGLIVKKI